MAQRVGFNPDALPHYREPHEAPEMFRRDSTQQNRSSQDSYRPPISPNSYGHSKSNESYNNLSKPSSNDRDYLYRKFLLVDQHKNGELSEEELSNALVNRNKKPFDPKTVHMMVRMFDADRNGKINFDEFWYVMLLDQLIISGLWAFLMAWRKLFNLFDVDGNDTIQLNEFSMALEKFGYRLTPKFVGELYRAYDPRNEHSMNFDVFIQACLRLKTITDVFKKYDEDRDGYITLSFEEFLSEILTLRD